MPEREQTAAQRDKEKLKQQEIGVGPVGKGDYVVQAGDCMDSIAFKHGFFWETLWNHADNADLKDTRKDPFNLLPGDRVTIPDLTEKQESRATEDTHRFRRKGVPSIFKIQLMAGGKPRDGVPYRLVIDSFETKGETDAEGRIEVGIPPDAKKGKLFIDEHGEQPQTIPLDLGSVGPIDELIGMQSRLENLGYGCSKSGKLDDETIAALQNFQRAHELEPTGEYDQKTKDKLFEVYES